MLTRRHIRIKVLQSVYAYNKTKINNLEKQKKFLLYSIVQMQDLYLLLLDLLVSVQMHANTHLEKGKQKHLPTETDLDPNRKFVDNAIIKKIANNKLFSKVLEQKKLTNWKDDDEYVAIIFNELKKSDLYKEYLESRDTNFEIDKTFVISFFKEIIAPNDKLYEYLEDKRLTWLDDYPLVNTAIVKMFNKIKPTTQNEALLPDLYKNDDDLEFCYELFQKVVLKAEALEEVIVKKTPNWEKDRIADLDLILIKMGIAEFLYFPTIPVKVTINEYLEIAKEYSTPKSSLFINGILDKLVKEYTNDNKLNKIGRGLR